ncbi:MAG: Ig-like domain-containing protein [Ignavibacteriaceae bacterium]|nr:Ig-like domain-containing protein [Ignavibacteriaceae bacterium]
MNMNILTAALKYLAVFIFAVALLNGCKEANQVVVDDGNQPGDTGETSTFDGQIIDYISGSPIQSASVVVTGGPKELTLTTDTQGKFSGSFSLTSSINLTLLTAANGYLMDTTSLFLPKGKGVSVPIIQLSKQSTNSNPSGEPKSIWLNDLTSPVIGVKESGSEETARIVFEVQDSAGVPIDLTHTVDVSFRFGSHPNGGEVLDPPSVSTNNSGIAVVNLTSGFKAGVVQIIADIFHRGKKISSYPVAISIHGGLPDSAHFSIVPAAYNFPGWHIYNLHNAITALVGDKFSNPVRPSTSVYFSSTGGIIEGSALTNAQGIGSVDLISADPKPYHPVFGPGFATILAKTADENEKTLTREVVILFSGSPEVSVTPTSIDVPHAGFQNFTYYVQDLNGNPLSAGTSISVAIQGENVAGQGDLTLTLPDTQSRSWTQFSFLIYDTNDTVNVVKPVSAKISVDGPNGKAALLIGGSGH